MNSKFKEVNSFVEDVNLSHNCLRMLERRIKMGQLNSYELKKVLHQCEGIKKDMENLISLIKPKISKSEGFTDPYEYLEEKERET